MGDVLNQTLPAITALTGVALTFAGSAVLERYKWRRVRKAEQDERTLQVIADLVQSVTDLVRLFSQASERVGLGVPLDFDRLWDDFNDALGRVRRLTVFARLVVPSSMLPSINELAVVVDPCAPLLIEFQKLRSADGLLPPQTKPVLRERVDALKGARNELTEAVRSARALP